MKEKIIACLSEWNGPFVLEYMKQSFPSCQFRLETMRHSKMYKYELMAFITEQQITEILWAARRAKEIYKNMS